MLIHYIRLTATGSGNAPACCLEKTSSSFTVTSKSPTKCGQSFKRDQRTLAYLHSHLKYCMHENSYNLFFMPLTLVPDLPGNNCIRHSSPDALGEVFVPRGVASFATNKSRAKVKDRAILTSRQSYLPIINVYVYFCHCNCQVSVYDEVTCTTIITFFITVIIHIPRPTNAVSVMCILGGLDCSRGSCERNTALESVLSTTNSRRS